MGPEAQQQQQQQQQQAYLPMRIMPNGVLPLLMSSFAFHILPAAVGMFSHAAADALVASAMSARALPWTFGAFVFLIEAVGVRTSAPSAAQDLSEWMNAVRRAPA